MTFFSQGDDGRCCSFYIKNKLKSEILNDKKIYKQKCLFPIAKNVNWQILTKNINITEVHQFLGKGEEVTKKNNM